MNSIKTIFLASAICFAFITSCTRIEPCSTTSNESDETEKVLSTNSHAEDKRTYYDTLALETPEEAVNTFINAFHREDFITVYLVFAPSTQFIMQQHMNLLRYSQFFQMTHWDEIKADVTIFSQGYGHGEHSEGNMAYIFDQIMLSTGKYDAFLIDLRGNVTINSAKKAETSHGESAIDIITVVEGIEGNVVFRTVQAPSGRWRVYQVIAPNGNEKLVPWSISNESN